MSDENVTKIVVEHKNIASTITRALSWLGIGALVFIWANPTGTQFNFNDPWTLAYLGAWPLVLIYWFVLWVGSWFVSVFYGVLMLVMIIGAVVLGGWLWSNRSDIKGWFGR